MHRRDNLAESVPISRDALEAWTHDLRNPLAALVANVHHLRETLGPHLDDESEEVFADCLTLFGLIERYTANLDVLAQGDDVLPERGRPVPLVDLTNEVAKRLSPYASVTGHHFRVLVQCASEPSVTSDRAILRRVLENLTANALENSQGGPVDLVVSVRSRPASAGQASQEEGCITVVDQGPPWPAVATSTTTHSLKRSPGSRYGHGLGIDAAKVAARTIGATVELGVSARGEASAALAAPLYGGSSSLREGAARVDSGAASPTVSE